MRLHQFFKPLGAAHTTGPLGKMPKGLQKLNLARCSLTGKGVGQIAHSLSLNRSMPTSLQYLNFAENTLKDDINVIFFKFSNSLHMKKTHKTKKSFLISELVQFLSSA